MYKNETVIAKQSVVLWKFAGPRISFIYYSAFGLDHNKGEQRSSMLAVACAF
jgi:hypothetical protein